MISDNLHAILAAVILPLERLKEVPYFVISHTPFQLLLAGFLGYGEASQHALHSGRSPTVRTLSNMMKEL